ncbi:hypothetical protein [Sphingosinicella terrae]|uniref:hypothetical protein n=1 Tax=Sphingosinicella terrae TaxID=2172047 RepID=UPI000E0CEC54|nr:hypothetical protein [Sphingosinicella terrae]
MRLALGFAAAAAAIAAVAGCGGGPSEAEAIETLVREQLAAQGVVEAVELEPAGANSMVGHAVMRDNLGRERRLNCTARRDGQGGYDYGCVQTIDAGTIAEMEAMIRERFEAIGEVDQVELARVDEDNMRGQIVYRDPARGEVRAPCRAVRDAAGDSLFSWRCGEAAEAWAAERMRARGASDGTR